ncbi:MAG: ribonuclease HII [Candidatus Tectomicrobia bacterium]|uniref:Ribonuclease HII n=1 Tax=Tectimicrobiota bacterium TaxID=2528274 RepID=A0A937VXV4_UNCTE|nr:ribonuclease HII [Candidatus Tectomicrobia bacterium]
MARRQTVPPVFVPLEQEVSCAGYRCIAGLDEAGRGPLAGPVVAAAVILPVESRIPGLQDSKRLTARQRDSVYDHIQHQALAYGIGMATHTDIDQHNILRATQAAMLSAVRQCALQPDMLLIDGNVALPTSIAQRLIIRGDACCASIAAASILAKVTRDRLMLAYAQEYPLYGFERHKGYPTPEHYARLRTHGPCPIHRRTFRGVLAQSPAAGRAGHA